MRILEFCWPWVVALDRPQSVGLNPAQSLFQNSDLRPDCSMGAVPLAVSVKFPAPTQDYISDLYPEDSGAELSYMNRLLREYHRV